MTDSEADGSISRTIHDAFDRLEAAVERLEEAVESSCGPQVPVAEDSAAPRPEVTEATPPGVSGTILNEREEGGRGE